MINILVSVDFSKNARQVARCTAEIAHPAKARLILFHVYRPDEATDTEQEDLQSERCVQARLDKLARHLHKKTGVSITRLMKPMAAADEALEIARLVKADVAVVCDQSLQSENRFILSSYEGIPVITVASSHPVNQSALKQHLTDQLNSHNSTATPLLEAI